MIHKIIREEIRVPGTLEDAYLETFLLSVTDKFTVQERPLILVCPGGGYNHTSDREAEIVAMQFNAMGYHTAVLRYSCRPAVFPTALLELTRAVAYFRDHAGAYCIDPERIAVLGFSAAGHLAATLSVYWNTEWFAQIRKENGVNLTAEQIRPDGLILAYPVITSGEFAHRGSFDDLLGEINAQPDLADTLPCYQAQVEAGNIELIGEETIEAYYQAIWKLRVSPCDTPLHLVYSPLNGSGIQWI